MKKQLITLILFSFSFGFSAIAQDDVTTKQKQLEEIKKQLQQEQKTIQQQQEWNNQSAEQEIKKLNKDNRQKTFEAATMRQEAERSRDEAARAKTDAKKAVADLEVKKKELNETLNKIDSAKVQLAETEALLQTADMINKRIMAEKQRQEDSLKIMRQEQLMSELQLVAKQAELDTQKQRSQLFIVATILSLSLLAVIIGLFVIRQKGMRELAKKNVIIEEEKKRSDELLLNILPEDVMKELKAKGKTQPRDYRMATVLFADIKDFTKISELLSPDELVEALETYFECFDTIIGKYGIEKIKTIGDAYVCAGGIPTSSEDNPNLVVRAALDFVSEIDRLRKEREKKGLQAFSFRIGIHTGQLVAGVIGMRKFAYDIWGDTVNMAARMEQSSEPNKINVSGATYTLIKDKFACIYRGKLEAKNKGEIDMYFVEKTTV